MKAIVQDTYGSTDVLETPDRSGWRWANCRARAPGLAAAVHPS